MEVSKLSFYNVGTAAENKALSSPFLEVTPLEDMPFVDGELTDNADKFKSKGKDSEGQSYQHEIDSTVTVKAKWLPIGQSNRLTPPDVRRGEMVVLYRFADNDEFWWSTLQHDINLRRLETVIYGIVATPKDGVPATHENMYWFEMSSHNKMIHLHTSKANGEFCTYDIQINAGEGIITIQDDIGNEFVFDSKEHRIEIMNADGSHVDVNKTKISLKATDEINIESKVINVKSETTNETSTTHNITSSTVNSKSTFKHTGTMASSGIISSAADVKAGSISLTGHKHSGIRGGTDTSGAPS